MAAGCDPEAGVRCHAPGPARLMCVAAGLAGFVAYAAPVSGPQASPAAVPTGCFAGTPAPAPTGTVTAEGDVALGGGAVGRLAGLAPPTVDRAALAALLGGGSSQVRAAGRADRWGRLPVEILTGGAHVAAALLAEGQGAVRPGELPAACTRSLLAIEDDARRAGRGRWAAGVLDAADGKAVAAQEGRFVVAEGRVTGIGRTASRFYLNFGAIRGESFAATVPTRALQKFEASGMRLVTLEGRRIRVRGVVVGQGGPRVEVALPEEIERLD